MFATLIVQLPCEYNGGQLIVKHKGNEKIFDFTENSTFTQYYAALYADCEHELKPLTKGYRLCLVYNLIYADSGPPPEVPENSKTIDTVVEIIKRWEKVSS
jgi:hypothetical protein